MPSDSYAAKHQRVYRARGRASARNCVMCGAQARHWATIHGTDGSDVWQHYMPLCVACHVPYDKAGVPQSPEQVELRSQQLRGQLRSHNTSGVPGVHWHAVNQNWRVQVNRTSGGSYPNLADAVKARNELAVRLYGLETPVYDVPESEQKGQGG